MSETLQKISDLIKIFFEFLYEPLVKPLHFYRTKIEKYDNNTTTFLWEMVLFLFFLMTITSITGVDILKYTRIGGFFGLEYGKDDLLFIPQIVGACFLFMVLTAYGTFLALVESFGLMFMKFNDFNLKDYIYFRIFTTVVPITLFYGIAILLSFVTFILLKIFEYEMSHPLIFEAFLSLIFVGLLASFLASWFVVWDKTGRWWSIFLMMVGYLVFIGTIWGST